MTLNSIQHVLQNAINNYNRKNFTEAKEQFYEVLDTDPLNPEANYFLGLMYTQEENFSKAVIYLKTLVDAETYFLYTIQCRMILGYIYFSTGELERAEKEYTMVLEANTRTIQVYAALSAISYHLGKKEKALQFAEKAYDIDNLNVNAKNTYSFLLCDYDINPQKGLELAKELVRKKPDNPAYLDTLGWAYYKNGDRKTALTYLGDALDLSHHNKEILAHYEDVLGKKRQETEF